MVVHTDPPIGQPPLPPRNDHIKRDEYFMIWTLLESKRRIGLKDAVIILNDSRQKIGGAASTCAEEDNTEHNSSDNHAAYKALIKIQKGSVIYTKSFPCAQCADMIVEAGITEVVYFEDKSNDEKVKDVFRHFGVFYRKFSSNTQAVVVDLNDDSDDS